VVEHLRADVVRARVRRHDHGGHPEPVPVVAARPFRLVLCIVDVAWEDQPQQALQPGRGPGEAASLHVIGRRRGGGRDMIVVAAVLVIYPDQQGAGPSFAVHDPVDHLGGEALALSDVLRILFGVDVKIGVHDAERGQRAGVGIREELVGAADVQYVPRDAEREDVGGELQVLLDSLGHVPQRPAHPLQPPPGHAARVMGITPGHVLVPAYRVVVGPGDPVLGEQVEDGPGGRVVEQVERQVVDEAVRGSRDEEAAVGERGPQA